MSNLSSEWVEQGRALEPQRPAGTMFPSSSLLLTGLVVVAAGALARYYLGPDLVRYMKIREM